MICQERRTVIESLNRLRNRIKAVDSILEGAK